MMPQEDDLRYLQGIKKELADPDDRLYWDFSNTSAAAVCNFNGVTC
jgi:hypothetical protein